MKNLFSQPPAIRSFAPVITRFDIKTGLIGQVLLFTHIEVAGGHFGRLLLPAMRMEIKPLTALYEYRMSQITKPRHAPLRYNITVSLSRDKPSQQPLASNRGIINSSIQRVMCLPPPARHPSRLNVLHDVAVAFTAAVSEVPWWGVACRTTADAVGNIIQRSPCLKYWSKRGSWLLAFGKPGGKPLCIGSDGCVSETLQHGDFGYPT